MSVLDGMFTGLVIGVVCSIPALVYDVLFHKHRDLPLVVDVRSVWGKVLPARDVFPASIALHLFFAVLFGAGLPLLSMAGFVPSYAFRFVVAYGLCFFLLTSLLLLPLAGLGLFGRKEGPLVWIELLLTHVLYALGFWYAATYLLVA